MAFIWVKARDNDDDQVANRVMINTNKIITAEPMDDGNLLVMLEGNWTVTIPLAAVAGFLDALAAHEIVDDAAFKKGEKVLLPDLSMGTLAFRSERLGWYLNDEGSPPYQVHELFLVSDEMEAAKDASDES